MPQRPALDCNSDFDVCTCVQGVLQAQAARDAGYAWSAICWTFRSRAWERASECKPMKPSQAGGSQAISSSLPETLRKYTTTEDVEPSWFLRRCLGRKCVCLMSRWHMLAIAGTCMWLAVFQVKRPSRKWPSVSKTPKGSSCMTSLWGEFVEFWVKPSGFAKWCNPRICQDTTTAQSCGGQSCPWKLWAGMHAGMSFDASWHCLRVIAEWDATERVHALFACTCHVALPETTAPVAGTWTACWTG